ncbi:MAG TPA: CsbD family protein [Candidatus Methylomirabilis sp.]|nr:CsbD family protein [Candidatus Methylomirabilis sp.]
MNKDILEGKWKELKSKVKEQWGKLTDDDLDRVEGQSERLIGLLQQRYGYAREKAEQEYKQFVDRCSSAGAAPAGRPYTI